MRRLSSNPSVDSNFDSVGGVMSTDLAISATTAPDMPGSQVKWKNILVAVILFVIVIVTIGGNVIVLLAFGLEKKLRNTFTLYVANLAFTDLMVGSVAMLFYTFDTVLGYWPFGQFMCGIWIFFDYAMTFASVFTLVAISFDRSVVMLHSNILKLNFH